MAFGERLQELRRARGHDPGGLCGLKKVSPAGVVRSPAGDTRA